MRIALASIILLLATNSAPPLYAADSNKSSAQPTQNTQLSQNQSLQRAPAVQGSEAKPPSDAAQQKESKIEDYTFWLTVFTAALVVATMLLAAPALWMACIGRRTAERQLRAYVVVDSATVELKRHSETNRIVGVTCRVSFMNAGQTPAYDLEYFRSETVRPYTLDPRLPDDSTRAHRTTAILGPRIEHPDNLGTGMNFDETQVTEFQRGHLSVWMWGMVSTGTFSGSPDTPSTPSIGRASLAR